MKLERQLPNIHELWTVSFSEHDDRELTVSEIALALRDGLITRNTLVWHEGMPEWKRILESADLVRALGRRLIEVNRGARERAHARPPVQASAPNTRSESETDPAHALPTEPARVPSPAPPDPLPHSVAVPMKVELKSLGADVLTTPQAESDAEVEPPPISVLTADVPNPRQRKPPPAPPVRVVRTGPPGRSSRTGVPQVSIAARAPAPEIPKPPSEARRVIVSLLAVAAIAGGFLWYAASPTSGTTATREQLARPAPLAAAPVVSKPVVPSQISGGSTEQASPRAQGEPVTPGTPRELAVNAAENPIPAAPPRRSSPARQPPKPAVSDLKGSATAGESTPPAVATFDTSLASAGLAEAAQQSSTCRAPGDPSGIAKLTITFSPSGRVTQAQLQGPPFAGTATGSCIANRMRGVSVPPFSGDRITVTKTVVIQ